MSKERSDAAKRPLDRSVRTLETSMHDVFQPRHEPARSIYNTFQAEARCRKGRSVEEWMAAEREAVMREAVVQAARLGLRVPTMDEIVRAERYASGSVDYGAKWAYGVTEAMKSSNAIAQGREHSERPAGAEG